MLSGMMTSRITRWFSVCSRWARSLLLARALDGGQRAHALARHSRRAPGRWRSCRRAGAARRGAAPAAWPAAGRCVRLTLLGASSSSSGSATAAARGAHHIGLDALDRGLALGLRHHGLCRRPRAAATGSGSRGIDLAPGLGGLAAGFFLGGLRGLFLGAQPRFLGLLLAAQSRRRAGPPPAPSGASRARPRSGWRDGRGHRPRARCRRAPAPSPRPRSSCRPHRGHRCACA